MDPEISENRSSLLVGGNDDIRCQKLQNPDASIFLRKRYFVCIWTFFGFAMLLNLGTNLSIAIVDMTSAKNITTENGTYVKEAEFHWDSKEKGFIISSLSYGCFLSPLGGVFIIRYGGVNVFGYGIIITALFTILSPFLLRFHFPTFIIARILEGVSASFALSSYLNIYNLWAPPHERSRLIILSLSGAYIGVMMNYILNGYICDTYGYNAVFVGSGVLGIAWCFIWFLFVSNNPLTDRFITEKERNYFKNFIYSSRGKKNISIPWKKVLTSKPLWAMTNEYFCNAWTFSFFMFCIPLYIKDTFNANSQTIGMISGIPVLGNMSGTILSAFVADYLRSSGFSRIPTIHRIFITIGQLMSMSFLLVAALWDNLVGSIVAFTLMRFLFGIAEVSYNVVLLDMFSDYAGIARGICAVASNTAMLLNPTVMGFFVVDGSRSSWNLYFLFLSAFNIISFVIYFIFGSGELQEWAAPKDTEESKS